MPADWRHQDYRWCIAMAQNSQNEQRRRYSCIIETTRVGNVVCSTSLMLVFWCGRRKALLFCGSKIKSNVRMALHSALCCGGGFLDDRNWNQQNEDIQLTCMLRMHNNLLLLLSTAHPIQFTQFSFRCRRRRCRFAGSFQYILLHFDSWVMTMPYERCFWKRHKCLEGRETCHCVGGIWRIHIKCFADIYCILPLATKAIEHHRDVDIACATLMHSTTAATQSSGCMLCICNHGRATHIRYTTMFAIAFSKWIKMFVDWRRVKCECGLFCRFSSSSWSVYFFDL